MNITESINNKSLINKKMNCTYDEFSHNNYLNQIIKTTMQILLKSEIKKHRKKRLKRILIAIVLSVLPIIGIMADGVRFLVVNAKDGTKTTFGLAEEPKISFSNGELSIVSSIRTFSISLADIQNYAFSDESTGIDEVIKAGNVRLENGFVVFNGLAAGSKVAVYMQDGKKL